MFEFDLALEVIHRQVVGAPDGCEEVPHAALVSAGGSDYVVGTCTASDRYFAIAVPYAF
jgi:hypothetical protein